MVSWTGPAVLAALALLQAGFQGSRPWSLRHLMALWAWSRASCGSRPGLGWPVRGCWGRSYLVARMPWSMAASWAVAVVPRIQASSALSRRALASR